jgi:hypothetical protein
MGKETVMRTRHRRTLEVEQFEERNLLSGVDVGVDFGGIPRVMPDSVILADGQISFVNGATTADANADVALGNGNNAGLTFDDGPTEVTADLLATLGNGSNASVSVSA